MGEDTLGVVKEAYGLLWQITTADKRVHGARRLLLSLIDKDGQKQGIENTKPLPCGHPMALGTVGVETGIFACELCDIRHQRDDAVAMEVQYLEERNVAIAQAKRAEADLKRALEALGPFANAGTCPACVVDSHPIRESNRVECIAWSYCDSAADVNYRVMLTDFREAARVLSNIRSRQAKDAAHG